MMNNNWCPGCRHYSKDGFFKMGMCDVAHGSAAAAIPICKLNGWRSPDTIYANEGPTTEDYLRQTEDVNNPREWPW